MPVETVFLCPYTHADWAWNFYRAWHAKRYIRACEIALNLMDQHPDFTWFIDTWNDQLAPVVEHRPDLVERIAERVAEGRFGLAAGHYANPHPDRCGRETYIRNTLYGHRQFRELFPDAAFPAATHMDTIVGHSQLPQLLTKMGFSYYYGCRSRAAMDARGVPRQFLWRGLDGSAIACERAHYGVGVQMAGVDIGNWAEARQVLAREIAGAESQGTSPILSIRFGGGDDCLPLGDPTRPIPLFEYLEAWRENETVEIRFATPASFGRELAARDDLPEWEGPLDCVGWSYWHAQVGGASLARWRQRADLVLCQAETASLHAQSPYAAPLFEALWADLLSTHSHATLWLWEPDYEHFLGRVQEVVRSADELLEEARQEVLDGLTPAADGTPVVLFNPLAFDRDEALTFTFPVDEAGWTGLALLDGGGEAVLCQFVQDGMHDFGRSPDGRRYVRECRVTARVAVPACGYATVYVQQDNEAKTAALFELAPTSVVAGDLSADTRNGSLDAVALRGLGSLVQRLDLAFEEIEEASTNARMSRAATLTGPDVPAPDLPDKAFGGHTMHYGPVIGRQSFRVEQWSVMEAGPLGARLFFRGSIADNPAELEAFVHADRPRIDCEARVYVVQPKSGYFLASVTPTFEGLLHVDVPFGVEPRVPVSEPYGVGIIERGEFESFWGFSWCDLSDGRRGVAILAEPGQQGYRYRDGRLEHFLLKTIAPDNLRGKRWTTKHRTGLGYQAFRFALVLHRGDWREAQLYREIERWRQPLVAREVLGRPDGSLPDAGRGLAVGPDNVMLSAFFQDYQDVVLRVYENEGRETRAEVELPGELPEAELIDLLGQPIDEGRAIQQDGRRLAFDVAPWEIVTLRFPSPEVRGEFPFDLPPEEPPEPEEPPTHPRWRT